MPHCFAGVRGGESEVCHAPGDWAREQRSVRCGIRTCRMPQPTGLS